MNSELFIFYVHIQQRDRVLIFRYSDFYFTRTCTTLVTLVKLWVEHCCRRSLLYTTPFTNIYYPGVPLRVPWQFWCFLFWKRIVEHPPPHSQPATPCTYKSCSNQLPLLCSFWWVVATMVYSHRPSALTLASSLKKSNGFWTDPKASTLTLGVTRLKCNENFFYRFPINSNSKSIDKLKPTLLFKYHR